jgi:hypothetical protein
MISMIVTDIYGGQRVLVEGVATSSVPDALVHCEAGETQLSFKTTSPKDFYVGQEVHVNIFVPNPSLHKND